MLHPTTLQLTAFFVAIALSCASPGSAQSLPEPWADPLDHPGRVDVSASLAVGAPTDWSDLVVLGSISPAVGVFEQVLMRDLRVKPDTAIGGAVTYWRGRYGFRAHATLSRSTLVAGEGPVDISQRLVTSRPSVSVDVDTWSYDVNGVIGLTEYTPTAWVWPYASFGFGGITYDLGQPIAPPLLTFIEGGGLTTTGNDVIVVNQRSREFLLAVNELSQDTVFAVNVAVGTDVRLPIGPGGVGLRLELSDHMASSPVRLWIGELRRANLLASDSGIGSKLVHHLRAAAAFVVYLGR